MAISKEVIEQIRQQSSIENIVSQVVSLQPSGRPGTLKGLCPFHQEDTPSFTVNTNKNLFFCFGCQEGGDIFGFIQKTRGLSFGQVVRELAEDCGISLKDQTPEEKKRFKKIDSLYEVCQLAAEFFHRELQLSNVGKEAKEYLKERGLNDDVIRDFGLGYSPPSSDDFINYMHRQQVDVKTLVDAGLARYRDRDNPGRGVYSMFRNRLMIPIHNQRGKIVAFGGRRMPNDTSSPAKYINSPETIIYKKSQVLYGLSFARASIQRKKRVIIVEGYFDVIAMHMNGFKETIASCGTALTPEHVKILRPLTRRAIAMFDMDEAGRRAAERSLPIFWKAGIEPLRLSLGDAKDPDEYFLEATKEDFEKLLGTVEPLFLTKLHQLQDVIGTSPGAKQEIIEELSGLLNDMPIAARDASIVMMSAHLGVSDAAIRSQLSSKVNVIKKKEARDVTKLFSRRLADLLWFSLHHPFLLRKYLEDVEDPTMFSDDHQVIVSIAMLMEGQTVEQVLEEISADALRKLLLQLAIREDLYEADMVDAGIRQLVALYKKDKLEIDIRNIQSEISQLSVSNKMSEIILKLEALQHVRKQYENLQKQIQAVKQESEE